MSYTTSPEEDLSIPDVEVLRPLQSTQERDRVNNVAQKEKRLEEAGVTRRKAYLVIAEALEAVIKVIKRDSEGREIISYEPDWEKRKWGAEQAAKIFGDYITHVDANIKVTHSVEELLKVYERAKLRCLKP